MKNKIIFLTLLLCAFSVQIKSQGTLTARFDDGINVVIKSRTIPAVSKSDLKDSYEELFIYNHKNTANFIKTNGNHGVIRAFINHSDKISFNYSIDIQPNSDKKTFVVTINPKENQRISGETFDTKDYQSKSLPNYPTNITVNDGDTIVLDILENPKTGAKVQDLIKITGEYKPFGDYFSDLEEPKDFSIEDVQLQLADYKLYLNGRLIEKDFSPSVRSRFIGFEFNRYKEALVLTAVPVQGYDFKKVGVITGNKMVFDYNGDKFEIVSTVPILGLGKKWNLWMANPPREHKDYRIPDNIGFITRSLDKITEFFPSRNQPKKTINILREADKSN